MKIVNRSFLLLFAAVAAFAAFGGLAPQRARADVSVSFFYDTLDPYGEWVQTPDYGYCWHPTGVSDDWAPYQDGYWAYTDSGWTWVSYEDYGEVVYHYGRWTRYPGEGWVWVPGNTWAPAWVSWRSNDDYVGWAPLPPEAHWQVGVGFGGWVDSRFDVGPGFYSFVGVRDFGSPSLQPVIINREQNVTIINNTTNITNITTNNSNVYVGGPRYATIAARSAKPIPTLRLVRQGDASLVKAGGGKFLNRREGNQLMVLAPRVNPVAKGAHIAPAKVAKTLTDVKADRGWSDVKDPSQAEKLRTQFKDQASKAGTTAKPVNADDVKLVNEKIKENPKALATEGGASATPKPGKGKKNKTPTNEDLLNQPAVGTETPATAGGAATPEATPKAGKGKKSHDTTKQSFLDTTGNGGEATPAPKTKGKKSKTPSESNESSQGNDSGLQPFMGGGGGNEAPTPKAKKNKESNPDYNAGEVTPKAKKNSENDQGFTGEQPVPKVRKNKDENNGGQKFSETPNSFEGRQVQPGNGQGEGKQSKGKKGKKGGQDQNTPPGQ